MDETLPDSVHDIWCRKHRDDHWRIQFMLDESVGSDWVSRRDRQVRAPIRSITLKNENGVRFLAPHIQLYYKAKSLRDKDEVDLHAVLDRNDALDKDWLIAAIKKTHGSDHPWMNVIATSNR